MEKINNRIQWIVFDLFSMSKFTCVSCVSICDNTMHRMELWCSKSYVSVKFNAHWKLRTNAAYAHFPIILRSLFHHFQCNIYSHIVHNEVYLFMLIMTLVFDYKSNHIESELKFQINLEKKLIFDATCDTYVNVSTFYAVVKLIANQKVNN